MTLYALCVVGFFLANPDMDHATLSDYFASTSMVAFSTLMVLSTAAHAWIGMWTIGTDYIREHYFGKRETLIRGLYQIGCVGTLFLYVAWGLQIFWEL